MNYEMNQDVRDLLAALKERNTTKDQKLQTCARINMLASTCSTIDEFTSSWRDVFFELTAGINGRNSIEVKRCLGDTLAHLISFLPYELGWFITHISEEYKSLHPRADDERVVIINAITQGTQRTFLRRIGGIRDHEFKMELEFVVECLGKNNSRTVLPALLDAFVQLTAFYPDLLEKEKYMEVVDVTIGWLVEQSSPVLVQKCQETLLALKHFWGSSHDFAHELIGHFREDIYAYVQDTIEKDELSCLRKARAVMLTMSTVLGIFVEFGPSEHTEILDIVRQVLTSCAEFSYSLQHIHSYHVAMFFSSFCTVFATILKMCNNEMAKPIIKASIDETTRIVPLYMYNPNAFSEFMEFLTKANNMCELPLEHAESVAEAIIGENGFLRLHDFRNNSRLMCTTISRLLASFLSKLSMAQLQSSFSLIKSVMVEDAAILSNAMSSHNLHCHMVQQAEARLIVFVKSLESFAVVKNSLIAIMGVKPSLLNFLCLELPLTSPGFSKKFPAVHLAILKVVVSHVESHDFFLANSEWLTGAGRGGIIGESVTSKHVQLQMQTISRCLQDGIKWKHTRELVCDWLTSLVSRIDEKSLAQIVKRKEWKSVRTALINAHMKDDVEESFLEVAKKLAVLNLENDSDAVNLVSALTHKISTMNSLKGVKIRNGIDSKILIRSSVSARGWDAMENRQQRVLNSNFNAADFTLLSDFLLREIAPSRSLNPTEDDLWLFDTIDALYCTTEQNKNSTKFLQKWRWALAQMALHCVENRMKTSLGKPMETFNAIGAEMQRLAKEALGLVEYQKVVSPPLETPKMPRKTSNKDEEEDEEYGRARTLTDSEEWWRVRCLLEFVEILDKLMSNANMGFVFPITNVSQLARQFFTANSASCQEWLNRTYSSAMVVAYHNGAYAQVIRFGSSALVDLEKKQQRVDAKSQENDEKEGSPVQGPPPSIAYAIIGWMARAMVEMGAVQATKGLQKWMKKVYKIEADWLEGAVQMASSRLEDALVSFNKALLEDSLPDTARTLIRSMIFDILNRLRLPTLLEPAICPPGMCIWTEAEALSSSMPRGFDVDALIKLKQLCTFVKADQVAPNPVRWDVSRSLFTKETQLMQTLRRAEVLTIKDDASNLGTLVLMGDSGLRNQGRIALFEKIVTAVVSKMNKFHNTEAELSPSFLTSGDCYSDIGERLSHARRMSFWGERLAGGVCVHEETAILARKTGNEMLAMTLLQKALATVQPGRAAKLRLIAATQRAKMLWSKGDEHQRSIVWSETFISMAAALQIENQRQQFLILVNQDGNFSNGGMAFNMGGMSNGIDMQTHAPVPGFPIDYESCGEEISKTALRLAEWLTVQPAVQISPEVYPTPLWSQLEAMAVHIGGDVVGSLLALASSITPSLAKAHLRLADWSYNVSTAGSKEKEMFDNNYRVLLGDVQQSVLDGLWKALNTCTALSDLEKTVHSILSYDVTSAKSLLSYGSHYTNLWSQLVQRRSVFLTNAVNSYFAYISQLGSKDESSAGSVSATLRILGLLANHSDILQTHLEEGIVQTNELLWKDILPQLFSRLSHPNRIVRDLIVSLLSKLCTSSPHSLIFQVVSGTASISFVEDSDDVLESDEREDEDAKKEKSLMVDCCRQLEGILQDMYPNLVRDVKEFVNELQKISLLYEEKWTFVLSNLDHEMAKRLEQINVENERTKNAIHLDEKTRQDIIAEKAKLITSPVYRILSDLYERTCENPVTTANEDMFVRYFSSDLKAAFDQSKANCKNPEKAWAPFRDILRVLQQKGMRRGTQAFNMDDISTVLTKLHGTCIPLPGQDKVDYSEVLTLEKVGNTAQVLPTKTRPKKMLFIGSDGKEHIYLFKGQEDLHLDERIMQLLNICNLMLGKSSTRDWPAYCARHYAVTPLGTRSGLIQWVGGATPMFQIYRKWQQKQAQIKNSMEKKNGISVTVSEVERPTDMYQKTIRAAFLKHKIPPEIIADRAKWPQFLLKEVLTTLMRETPRDILSRELWVRAGSSDTWWRVSCRLARSSAVMSIIGAILGLGDRHLDNLLVNLDKGEIVHIDYNICFDKGKNLRVPETVPFRLTQNLVHAMGPTQIEGVFRESCYHVMGNLRESREVLLTILEAFVYDPLVDWAAGDHLTTSSAAVSVAVALAVYGSDSRVHEAKPIARNMFTVRTKELAMPWMRNCHELTVALDSVRSILRRQLNIGSSVWDKPETLDQERVEAGRKLKLAIGVHHQMMKDFRPLLRALATCDERFAMFTKRYKELFSEPLIKGHQLLDSQPVNLAACISQFDIVLQHIARIYGDLITLDVSDDHDFENKTSQMRNLTPPPGLEDPGMRGGQQEQNAHAKNVVRRVRARLEGRADDSRIIHPVEEQVDSLIRQATSTTLLSLMYEGWTAWV